MDKLLDCNICFFTNKTDDTVFCASCGSIIKLDIFFEGKNQKIFYKDVTPELNSYINRIKFSLTSNLSIFSEIENELNNLKHLRTMKTLIFKKLEKIYSKKRKKKKLIKQLEKLNSYPKSSFLMQTTHDIIKKKQYFSKLLINELDMINEYYFLQRKIIYSKNNLINLINSLKEVLHSNAEIKIFQGEIDQFLTKEFVTLKISK